MKKALLALLILSVACYDDVDDFRCTFEVVVMTISAQNALNQYPQEYPKRNRGGGQPLQRGDTLRREPRMRVREGRLPLLG